MENCNIERRIVITPMHGGVLRIEAQKCISLFDNTCREKQVWQTEYITMSDSPIGSFTWKQIISLNKPPIYHNNEYIQYTGKASFVSAIMWVLV